MRRIALLTLALGSLVPILGVAPAHAQATRTWVSGVGDDLNPCSRTAPCKTFAGAISKTAAGGEINCLDPGAFGAVTITKAMNIVCHYTEAGVLATLGSNGIVINAAATDQVYLKGLDIEGAGTGNQGVRFIAGGGLMIEDSSIRDFGANNGLGIAFVPTTAGARLDVLNTVVHHNGNAVGGGGIQIAPSGAGTAKVVLSNVTASKNQVGIAALGSAHTVQIEYSTISHNATTGILITGGTLRIGRSKIVNNLGAATSGAVLSYLDNQINGNSPDTVPATAGGYH
jgi:hypothetical protein